jgi:hypothetical protein
MVAEIVAEAAVAETAAAADGTNIKKASQLTGLLLSCG